MKLCSQYQQGLYTWTWAKENIVCVCGFWATHGCCASCAPLSYGRQKVSIPKCNLTGRLDEQSTITFLPVGSHSGIDTFCLPWRQRAGDATTNVSCPKTFFLVNSVHTMFSMLMFMCRDPGDTTSKAFLVLLSAHCTPLKISLPKNKTTQNLKSASFVVIIAFTRRFDS